MWRPTARSSRGGSRRPTPGASTSSRPTSGAGRCRTGSRILASASMAILSIYLRQRGSPESKPVGAADTATGVEG
nr:DUF6766 family protein [Streptomyces stelliscabiei]